MELALLINGRDTVPIKPTVNQLLCPLNTSSVINDRQSLGSIKCLTCYSINTRSVNLILFRQY